MLTASGNPIVSTLRRWAQALRRTPPAAVLKVRNMDSAAIGRGFADPQHPGMRRIVVTVDEATFERVRARAVARKVSLAAAVRGLIERGFAAEEH
jgi:hypothetical protein